MTEPPVDSSPEEYVGSNPLPADGIINGIAGVFSSARRVVSDLFRLFSLEVRRAGLTLAGMVLLGAAAAMLIVTAWLGLMGALALLAVALGMTWIGILVVLALANLVAASIALYVCVRLSRYLLFPETQRQLEVPPARSATP